MRKAMIMFGVSLIIFTGLHFAQQGYVVAGSTESYTNGMNDFLIYKLDAWGGVQWRKNLGGIGNDIAHSIQQTNEGGYVVAGVTHSYTNGGPDFLIYKLDASGRKLWRKNLGGTQLEWAHSIIQTIDGGFVVAGQTHSYTHGTGDSDFLIYKLDTNGRKSWRKNLGGSADDYAFSILQTTDGGYAVAGSTESYTHGCSDFLIYKLDASGRKLWRKNLGGEADDSAYFICEIPEGGYVVAGRTESYTNGQRDFLIYKLDSKGSKQWRKNMGGTEHDSAASIQPTADGGYVVAGSSYSYTHGTGDADFLIYKLDGNGNKQWRKNHGGTENDAATSVQQTSDGGYVVVGTSRSYTYGGEDICIYKLAPDGSPIWGSGYIHLGGIADDRAYSIQKTVN